MKTDLTALMAQRTDAELLGVLTRRSGEYLPEVVAVAKKEFERRNFSVEQIEAANRLLELTESEREVKANLALESKWKWRAFFVPRVTNLVIAKTFKADGQLKKHDEAVRWTMYGVGFYAGLFTLGFLLDRFGLLK